MLGDGLKKHSSSLWPGKAAQGQLCGGGERWVLEAQGDEGGVEDGGVGGRSQTRLSATKGR